VDEYKTPIYFNNSETIPARCGFAGVFIPPKTGNRGLLSTGLKLLKIGSVYPHLYNNDKFGPNYPRYPETKGPCGWLF
jgi:hypothetical protein